MERGAGGAGDKGEGGCEPMDSTDKVLVATLCVGMLGVVVGLLGMFLEA